MGQVRSKTVIAVLGLLAATPLLAVGLVFMVMAHVFLAPAEMLARWYGGGQGAGEV